MEHGKPENWQMYILPENIAPNTELLQPWPWNCRTVNVKKETFIPIWTIYLPINKNSALDLRWRVLLVWATFYFEPNMWSQQDFTVQTSYSLRH
jgi:hypothetical protein